jgi:hypothetical protein
MADCLHTSATDVTGAFGGTTPDRTAQSATPTYVDPSQAGTAASSVVDITTTAAAEQADFSVLSNAGFASCYQAYAQSMLPYAGSASAFSSVTVTSTPVPAPTSSAVKAVAYQITRKGSSASVTTTAVAVFGGRIQATLTLNSTTSFPATTSSALLTAVEGRVAGAAT